MVAAVTDTTSPQRYAAARIGGKGITAVSS
jgi:hypothetical protein